MRRTPLPADSIPLLSHTLLGEDDEDPTPGQTWLSMAQAILRRSLWLRPVGWLETALLSPPHTRRSESCRSAMVRLSLGLRPWSHERRDSFVQPLCFFLLTTLSLGYFIKNLDQTNITKAYVSGMKADMKMNSNELNLIDVAWHMGYVVGQTPSPIIPTKVRPSIWVPSCQVVSTVSTLCLAAALPSEIRPACTGEEAYGGCRPRISHTFGSVCVEAHSWALVRLPSCTVSSS